MSPSDRTAQPETDGLVATKLTKQGAAENADSCSSASLEEAVELIQGGQICYSSSGHISLNSDDIMGEENKVIAADDSSEEFNNEVGGDYY